MLAVMGFFRDHGFPWAASWGPTLLPLGISFFTFTQIAFLVDTRRRNAKERGFLEYVLFVTFFPHLIAGPILHHREMMSQFADKKSYRFRWDNITIGISIFILGLTKKVLLADQLAPIANDVFKHTADKHPLEAWVGLVALFPPTLFRFRRLFGNGHGPGPDVQHHVSRQLRLAL